MVYGGWLKCVNIEEYLKFQIGFPLGYMIVLRVLSSTSLELDKQYTYVRSQYRVRNSTKFKTWMKSHGDTMFVFKQA